MHSVYEHLLKLSPTPEQFLIFFWAIKFFTGFHILGQSIMLYRNQEHIFDISFISSTMEYNIFLMILNNLEVFRIEKNYILIEESIAAIKEIMNALIKLMKSSDVGSNRIANKMKNKLIHDPQVFLEPIISMLKQFIPSKQSRTSLMDLIEIIDSLVILVEDEPIVVKKKHEK